LVFRLKHKTMYHTIIKQLQFISLEALAAKEFNEMFSDIHPRQDVKVYRHFRGRLRPHRQGIAGGLVEPEPMAGCPTVCCAYIRSEQARDDM